MSSLANNLQTKTSAVLMISIPVLVNSNRFFSVCASYIFPALATGYRFRVVTCFHAHCSRKMFPIFRAAYRFSRALSQLLVSRSRHNWLHFFFAFVTVHMLSRARRQLNVPRVWLG